NCTQTALSCIFENSRCPAHSMRAASACSKEWPSANLAKLPSPSFETLVFAPAGPTDTRAENLLHICTASFAERPRGEEAAIAVRRLAASREVTLAALVPRPRFDLRPCSESTLSY